MSDDQDQPRSANLPPGFDEEDPYEDQDLDEYPEWWRTNIERYRDHELRPYRPPRLAEGTFTPELIANLESKYGVTIQIRAVDPTVGDDWELWVDGEPVAPVPRRRDGAGYTVYGVDADEFTSLIRRAATDGFGKENRG